MVTALHDNLIDLKNACSWTNFSVIGRIYSVQKNVIISDLQLSYCLIIFQYSLNEFLLGRC